MRPVAHEDKRERRWFLSEASGREEQEGWRGRTELTTQTMALGELGLDVGIDAAGLKDGTPDVNRVGAFSRHRVFPEWLWS